MALRHVPVLAILGLLSMPALARPADLEKPATPALVVKLQPIEQLLANADLLATLADQEEVKQYAGLFKSMIGPRGLLGLDPKRPVGFYATLSANVDDSAPVMLLPVQNEKAVLQSLEVYKQKVSVEDGLYTVLSPYFPLPVYFRFANQYAYVTTLDKSLIAPERLLDPAKVLPEGETGVLWARLRLHQVPRVYKQILLAWFDLRLGGLQEKRDNESAAEHEIRAAAAREASRQLASLLHEGRELTVRIDHDLKTQNLTAELTLTAEPGSKLAETLKEIGALKNAFGSLVTPDAAANGLIHWLLPADGSKALSARLHEAIAESVRNLPDAALEKEAAHFLRTLEKALNTGEVDAAISIRGTAEKHYTVVAGAKVKDGKAVEKALRDLEGALPADAREYVKLDADKAGEVKIHRIDAQPLYDARIRRLLGDNPVYLAVRDDALVVALGAEGMKAIKEALAATPPTTGAPLQLEVSLARLLPLLAADEDHERIQKAIAAAFGKDRNADRVRIALLGGSTLKLRLTARTPVLKVIPILQGKAAEVKDQ